LCTLVSVAVFRRNAYELAGSYWEYGSDPARRFAEKGSGTDAERFLVRVLRSGRAVRGRVRLCGEDSPLKVCVACQRRGAAENSPNLAQAWWEVVLPGGRWLR